MPPIPRATATIWVRALADAEAFARSRPVDEVGCLYYSAEVGGFTVPVPGVDLKEQGLVVHFGEPGGVLPRVVED